MNNKNPLIIHMLDIVEYLEKTNISGEQFLNVRYVDGEEESILDIIPYFHLKKTISEKNYNTLLNNFHNKNGKLKKYETPKEKDLFNSKNIVIIGCYLYYYKEYSIENEEFVFEDLKGEILETRTPDFIPLNGYLEKDEYKTLMDWWIMNSNTEYFILKRGDFVLRYKDTEGYFISHNLTEEDIEIALYDINFEIKNKNKDIKKLIISKETKGMKLNQIKNLFNKIKKELDLKIDIIIK